MNFAFEFKVLTDRNAPINGLPQDGGAGQPTGIRLRKAHVGGDFDIHIGPQGGKFDSTAILKSGEDLRMSEWFAILEIPRSHLSEFPASKRVRSIVLLFFKAKMLFFMPISALPLKF